MPRRFPGCKSSFKGAGLISLHRSFWRVRACCSHVQIVDRALDIEAETCTVQARVNIDTPTASNGMRREYLWSAARDLCCGMR